jgi:L-serine deaminase
MDIVGVSASGAGIQLFGFNGGVYALGGAAFEGSLPGLGVNVDSVVGEFAI